MGWVGKILGVFGILFLVFMGIMFFYTRELQQESKIEVTMIEALHNFNEAMKLRDYDIAYKSYDAYGKSCSEYIKETGNFDCMKDEPILFNQIKKAQEQEKEAHYQELHDIFKYHIDLLGNDTAKANELLGQMKKARFGSVEQSSLDYQYRVAYGEYSNHVNNFINFLDENKEELIKYGYTEVELQKWKDLYLDSRSSTLEFINSIKDMDR